jgi:hypothetical protein
MGLWNVSSESNISSKKCFNCPSINEINTKKLGKHRARLIPCRKHLACVAGGIRERVMFGGGATILFSRGRSPRGNSRAGNVTWNGRGLEKHSASTPCFYQVIETLVES